MPCCSYNFGLIVLVIIGNFAKLDSPRRLVQFWKNFQTSLLLLIPNCTHNRMSTYTINSTYLNKLSWPCNVSQLYVSSNIGTDRAGFLGGRKGGEGGASLHRVPH